MKATFTEQYAVEQHLEEKKRAEDAEHLLCIKKAKNHVIGYGWAMVCHLLVSMHTY